ncbi:hypothetical protein U0070_025238, partial [Myodes glareolus]
AAGAGTDTSSHVRSGTGSGVPPHRGGSRERSSAKWKELLDGTSCGWFGQTVWRDGNTEEEVENKDRWSTASLQPTGPADSRSEKTVHSQWRVDAKLHHPEGGQQHEKLLPNTTIRPQGLSRNAVSLASNRSSKSSLQIQRTAETQCQMARVQIVQRPIQHRMPLKMPMIPMGMKPLLMARSPDPIRS